MFDTLKRFLRKRRYEKAKKTKQKLAVYWNINGIKRSDYDENERLICK